MRRALPRRALAAALAGLAAPAMAQPAEGGLARLAAARGVLFGTAVNAQWLREDPDLVRTVLAECGLVVPGLELKWEGCRPGPDSFDFRRADEVVAFAAANRLALRGHTLVWHEALPRWFPASPSAAELRTLLARHVATLGRRYAGRLRSWDVVNEPVEPWDRRPDGLRDSVFLRALGPGYVAEALKMAAEADPAARLVVNDYALELPLPQHEARRRAILELLNRLVRQGAPVHALGIQAHVAAGEAPIDPEVLRRFIRAVASLGLEVEVTELDVGCRLLPADIPARDAAVARTYAELLGAVLAEPAVKLVCCWGLSDRDSWLNTTRFTRRPDGLPVRAHPYDEAWRPKPAREAIARALAAAPVRA